MTLVVMGLFVILGLLRVSDCLVVIFMMVLIITEFINLLLVNCMLA
jgi:hypothetical protein